MDYIKKRGIIFYLNVTKNTNKYFFSKFVKISEGKGLNNTQNLPFDTSLFLVVMIYFFMGPCIFPKVYNTRK
jgi:hypothetical protein